MSAEAVGWVWNHSPYRGSELLVHLAIADVANDLHHNEFWMSTASLAKKAKVARSTVTATLSDMVKLGLLEVLEAGGPKRKPTLYRFTRPVSDITSAISPGSLDRSPVANPIDTNEQLPSAFSGLADKECFSCHGEGEAYHSGAGRKARCACTFDKPALSIVPELQAKEGA